MCSVTLKQSSWYCMVSMCRFDSFPTTVYAVNKIHYSYGPGSGISVVFSKQCCPSSPMKNFPFKYSLQLCQNFLFKYPYSNRKSSNSSLCCFVYLFINLSSLYTQCKPFLVHSHVEAPGISTCFGIHLFYVYC